MKAKETASRSRAARGFAGAVRLAAVVAAMALVTSGLISLGAWLEGALRWVEHLAPRPGLSGLVLLLLSPAAFLTVAFVVAWVAAGFRDDSGSG